jgi:hypothetical protein
MRTIYHAAAIALFSSGCVATNVSDPVEMGHNKYQINYIGGDASDIAPKAQRFCRSKGFDYAEMSDTVNNYDLTGNHTTFFCMHNGDTITHSPGNNTSSNERVPPPPPIQPYNPAPMKPEMQWCVPAHDGIGSQFCS